MRLIILCLFLTHLSCKNNEGIDKSLANVDLSGTAVTPRHYIVTKSTEPLVIDGKGDDVSWQNAPFTSSFIDIEGEKTPKFMTKAKMLWNEDYLYVYAYMEEPHIWGDIKSRDAIIYLNNDFEVFIDPSGDGFNYGEIEINALNTVWDLFLDRPYRVGGKANFHWNLDELQSAVFINGSLNDFSDQDSYWSLEIAIPLKPLIELKNRPRTLPKEGEQWRLNFSRVEWEHEILDSTYQRKTVNGKIQPEFNWVWSNQQVINMHEPEKWGFIQFTEANTAEGVVFNEDHDLMIKQMAFALFRKTRSGNLKRLLNLPVGSHRKLKITNGDDPKMDVFYYKTNIGFEYKIQSPVTKNTFVINEQGQLLQL